MVLDPLTPNPLRSIQGLSGEHRAQMVLSEPFVTGPSQTDGEPSQANTEASEASAKSPHADGAPSFAEKGSSQADRGPPSTGHPDR